MKILFMGTPDFAKATLKSLYESGENIIGVLTQTDKPKGRGMIMTPSPVKEYALSVGLDVYQPTTLRDENFAKLLESLDPDLIIVVAYGKILPQSVLDYPKYGCVNAHASLLPKYRGAAPIQRAIMNGERETGVTAMYMDAGIDTGDMILTEKIVIEEIDNFEIVHDKLAEAGCTALKRAIQAIKDGTVTREKQNDNDATYAAKIEKSDCVIDFSRTVREINDQIRGLSPIPLAFTHTANGKILKITSARPLSFTPVSAECGTVVSLDDGAIGVSCADGVIGITGVLPEGKGKMQAADFIRGRKISVGDKFLKKETF